MKKKFFFVFIVIIFLRVSIWQLPFSRDAFGYSYMGAAVAQGSVPYSGVWDHKPPGIVFFDYLIYLFSPDYIFGIQLLNIFIAILSFICFYKLMKNFFDESTAFISSVFFAVFTNVYMLTQGENMIEGYMLPFLVLTYLCFWNGIKTKKMLYFFLTGLFAGILFIFKQVGALPLMAIVLFLLIYRTDIIKRYLLLGLGFLTVITPVILYFIAHNSFLEMIDAVFLYNFSYSKQGYSVSSFGQSFYYSLQVIFASLPYWALMTVGMVKKKFDQKDILFALLFIFAFIGIAMGGRFAFTRNYFLLIFPSAGYFVAKAIQEIMKHITVSHFFKKLIIVGLIFLSLPPLLLQSQAILAGLYFREKVHLDKTEIMYAIGLPNYNFIKAERTYYKIGEYIKEHTRRQDYVLDWGAEPEIYLLSNTYSPTRYFYNFPINGVFISDSHQSDRKRIFIKEINSKKPVYIITNKNEERHKPSYSNLDFGDFKDFIHRYYFLEKTIDDYYIFKIKR